MKRILLGLLVISACHQVSALSIVVDYTYDTGNFFSSHAGATAAVEQAALDVGNVITSSLGALTPSSLSFSGTNGSTTATVDWSLNFTNPTSGSAAVLGNFSAATNEYRIFVGARNLGGSTLGVGGSSGVGLAVGGSGFESEWAGALAQAVSASNSVMTRVQGPVIGTVAGNAQFGASNPAYSLQFGLLAGTLAFNTTSSWQFDHTIAVQTGLFDFYSVAVHEIVHSLGFGGSESWADNHSGTTWLGANGIAANGGTGTGLLNGAADHVAAGVFSEVFANGPSQESVMSPSLTPGTRRFLTELDVAMLDDIGFSVSAIPEPSTGAFCVMICGAGLVTWVRRGRARRV